MSTRHPRVILSAALAAAAVLMATSGCTPVATADPEDAASAWIATLDDVSGTELRAYSDSDGDDEFVVATLADGLPDERILELVTEIGDGMNEHSDDFGSSIQLDFDGFEGSFFPFANSEPKWYADVTTALWLREDGRATSAAYTDYPEYTVVAPPEEVAALAPDFDDHLGDRGRAVYRVQSDDLSVVVEWQVADSLGFHMDRDAVGVLAAAQAAYPGTTGWVGDVGSGSDGSGAVWFDPDSMTLEQLAAGIPDVVDPAAFRNPDAEVGSEREIALEIGWGIARASYADFGAVYSQPENAAIARALQAIPGVRDTTSYAGSGEPSIDGVTVSDGASFAATADALAALRDAYLKITLVREVPDPVRGLPKEVFGTGAVTAGHPERVFFEAIADDLGVLQAQYARGYEEARGAATITLALGLTDEELVSAVAALRPVAADADIRLYGSSGDPLNDLENLGTIERGAFAPAADADPDLADAFAQAWR